MYRIFSKYHLFAVNSEVNKKKGKKILPIIYFEGFAKILPQMQRNTPFSHSVKKKQDLIEPSNVQIFSLSSISM